MCPCCNQDALIFEEFDYGTCSQTGYHDAGVRYRCVACGAVGDERDIDVVEKSEPVAVPDKGDCPF